LLISRFIYGQPIGPVRIAGRGGRVRRRACMVLGPEAMSGCLAVAALLPVAGRGAVRAGQHRHPPNGAPVKAPSTLLGGFFAALGVLGLIGMAALTLIPVEVPEGTAGFVLRGPVWPSQSFLFWTFVQAAGSLLGVGMMIKAYQLAEASRVSVFEYVILPASAGWSWLIWGETQSLLALTGMALIAAAGIMIALRARSEPDTSEPD
jgi:drug/metabolite transporter (DMT)-like permease